MVFDYNITTIVKSSSFPNTDNTGGFLKQRTAHFAS